MKYENGDGIKAGDIVTIDDIYSGQVVASMDTSDFLNKELFLLDD